MGKAAPPAMQAGQLLCGIAVRREQAAHILRQRGGDIQPAAGHRVQESETVGVQRRTGDEGGVLGAVEPIPGQRVAHGGEVEPQLVGAARLRQQPAGTAPPAEGSRRAFGREGP